MERRPLRIEHLSEAVTEIQKLANVGYDRAGNWNLEQIVDHLNRTMRMAVDGPPFRLLGILRPFFKWIVFGRMKRGVVIKFRAPAPAPLQPDDDQRLESLIEEFERLATLIESPDAKLIELHPLFGKFNREEWQINHRWHAAHHLSFLIPKESPSYLETESSGDPVS